MSTPKDQALADDSSADTPQGRLAPRLQSFLHPSRLALRLAHARVAGLPEFHAVVLYAIGPGGATVSRVTALVDADKGQVSRAVLKLTESELVTRAGLREPLRLTAEGERRYEHIVQILRTHQQVYLRNLTLAQHALFDAVSAQIERNAEALLPQTERDWLASQRSAAELRERAADADASALVVSHAVALHRRMARATYPVFKRLGELSQLEGMVLVQVAESAPLALAELIARMERDKSQIGRIVRTLVERGLVRRERTARDILLSPTSAGAELHGRIGAELMELNTQLLAGVGPERYRAYVGVLDGLAANARQLLAHEEAKSGRAASAA